jgi:hypothetical protein
MNAKVYLTFVAAMVLAAMLYSFVLIGDMKADAFVDLLKLVVFGGGVGVATAWNPKTNPTTPSGAIPAADNLTTKE